MRKNHNKIKFILLATLLGAFLYLFLSKVTPHNRSALLENDIFQGAIHSYRSIRKLPDILFFPFYLKKTSLPIYEISISPENLALLNQQLPEDPFAGHLSENNRLQVKGSFNADNYFGEVDLRFRGFGVQHWNAMKKSWRINFPNENKFQGIKSMNLVIPYDRWYFIESLSMHRAKKLGLTANTPQFVRLKINEQDMGVYLAWEQWSPVWLSRNRLPDSSSILAVDESKIGELDFRSGPYLETDFLKYWKSYTEELKEDHEELSTLVETINYADDKTFVRVIPNLIDLDKFFAWDALRAITGSNHQSDNYNNIILFNTTIGRFEFIPFDVFDRNVLTQSGYTFNDDDMLLTKRLYSIPEFRQKRNEVLKSYLSEENLKDDLEFFDNLFKTYRSEFFNDNTKLHNNIEFLSTVRGARALVIESFYGAEKILEKDEGVYNFNFKPSRKPKFSGSFARLEEIGFSKDEFLSENPSFYPLEKNLISIGPGRYFFKKDIIIPPNLKLIIQAGTTIYLSDKISLISYSPVEINGTATKKIYFKALDKKTPWGSLLILNTQNNINNIAYTEFENGSGTNINGVIATGMLSAYNSDIKISKSLFRNSFDDDAINVKNAYTKIEQSVFTNTHSDAVDLDMVKDGSLVNNNTFLKPIGFGIEAEGGDAIDISWSNPEISGNIISGCGDKGISIGESSRPLVKENIIENCTIGIAVKDSSRARIFKNEFKENSIAISAYKKKEEFGGGEAIVINSIFEKNLKQTEKDSLSEIILINTR